MCVCVCVCVCGVLTKEGWEVCMLGGGEESKLEDHPGQLQRAAVELAKMWRQV